MILVMAMQSYAVNCSMTETLHPDMPGACYVPGHVSSAEHVSDRTKEEDLDMRPPPIPYKTITPQEKADQELDWS